MNPALWAALGGTATVFLLLVGFLSAVLVAGRRARARDREALAAARSDVEALRAQLEELSSALTVSQGAATVVPAPTEYVITTAGGTGDLPQVPDRAVLSLTLGEPLVKLAAFGYGLRKALSAETRNRIAFEMRREVKRARKDRRRAARRSRPTQAQAAEEAA